MDRIEYKARSGSIDLEAPSFKRQRAGSISGRLRTASDLEHNGFITRAEKGLMKDLIISGDIKLQQALDKASENNDKTDE